MSDASLRYVYDESGNIYALPADVADAHRMPPVDLAELVVQVESVDFERAAVPDDLRRQWESTLEASESEVEGQDAGVHVALAFIVLGFRILRLATAASDSRTVVSGSAYTGATEELRVKPVETPVRDPSIQQPSSGAGYRTAAVAKRCQYCGSGMSEHQVYFSGEGLLMCKICFGRERLGEAVERAL